tara:strand:- start:680 stop:1021 length:342 start_codon:yes stop_codon:yes gene_type:complete
MDYFLKGNKTLLSYFLIMLIIISIFGLNIFISFIGNILLLLFLIPIFLLLVLFIGFKSYTSNISTCNECGAISFGLSDTCMNCGEELKSAIKENKLDSNPSERTIEVKAEEIK